MSAAPTTFDEAAAETFAGKLIETIDGSSLTLLISVAYRTGLFEVMSDQQPRTSEQIARDAALDERYVREVLGGLVVGEVVTYEPGTRTYLLPAEHAAFLTDEAGPDNLAFFTQYTSLLGNVENELVRVFREGGGIPYSSYDRFQTLQRDETARVYDAALVDVILPLADGVTERLTEGCRALDVGTGGGHAVNVMAQAFPNSTFRGIDISEEGVGIGRAEADELQLANATFDVEDAVSITGSYDLITAFDTIHDQAQPTKVLRGIASALRPGGVFLMGDIAFSSNLEDNVGNPLAATVFAFSVFHCMTVSLAQGGEGLGTAWGQQLAIEMLNAAGFDDVTTAQVEGDPLNIYYVCRRSTE